MDNKKYYIIRSLMMANALTLITGQMPYVFNDKYDNSKKVWSFEDNDKFQEALSRLTKLKNEFKNK